MPRAVLFTFLVWLLTNSGFAGDSIVVFNEVMYQPEGTDSVEWLELHNQMAVDVELSNWTLDGANFTFPTNTIIPGGGYVVIASDPAVLQARTGLTNIFGPINGRLDNSGETLNLRNHNGRLMDRMRYAPDAPWPEGAVGSGFTLAKLRATLGSENAANWTHSTEPGGTPGRVNFPQGPIARTIRFSEAASVTNTAFQAEIVNIGVEPVDVSAYEFVFSRAMNTTYQESTGTTVNPGGYRALNPAVRGYRPRADEKLFLFGPGRTNLIDVVTVQARARARDSQENWFHPETETFGAANAVSIQRDVVINEIMYRNQPLEAKAAEYTEDVVVPMDATWSYRQGSGAPANWNQPTFTESWPTGRALLGNETAALPEPIRTQMTLGAMAYYFRTEFNFTGEANGAELALQHIVDDGAVFYLNGREIYRFNMPQGTVTDSTPATPGVGDAVLAGPIAVAASNLVAGRNVLAVEVHQGALTSSDVVFGCAASLRRVITPARPFSESTEHWLELVHKGTNTINLSGWRIEGVDYTFPTNISIAGGEYLVVAQDAAAMRAKHPGIRVVGDFQGRLSGKSERIELLDAIGNTVDHVTYFDGAPWPEFADAQGASLELRNPHADNSKAEAWAESIEQGEWRPYSYSGVAQNDFGPAFWNEFVFGLLDAGEVLLDDFSVIEDPTSAARQLLQNGGFENGATSWRFLGTHRNAAVITDPENPNNKVLHLIADGGTEHMHNHVETTLVGNAAIQNGTAYQISFRAKMLGGCNKLNTRLYFNHVARTTTLMRPESGGTPGRRNSRFVENPGPTFEGLRHSPVVPNASEPVQISVRAEDPDGIAAVDLWWAVNGTNWTKIPMQADASGFTASIAAQTTARVVQFYVEGTDARGAKSFHPAEGPKSRALYKVNDGQALSPRLHNFRLIMLPADASALHAATNVMSNGRSLCTVIYDESEVFYDCGLHLQGSERGRDDPNRVGFTVNFPADQLFRGVQDTISFDRSGGWSGRGGRQDEILLRHLINQAGDSPDLYSDLVRVIAPLNTHTGTSLLLMAKYNDPFIDGSVYEKDGGLFKLELIYYPTTSVANNPQNPKLPQPDDVTGVDIGNLGNDPEMYRWFFIAENREWRNDYAKMIELAQVFSLSGAELESRTAALMDMEQWTRVFAFKSLSGDADTYGFGYPHNQLIYLPPQGKALTFPWDLDFAWTRGSTDPINVGNRIGEIIHGIPANHRLFLGHIDDIVRSSFNTNYARRWATHYGTLAGQNYGALVTWIGQRANAARNQLPAPAPFVITNLPASSLMVTGTEILLGGTAPYTMKRLRRNHEAPGAGFRWTARDNWETRVPLAFGPNPISVVGYDFRNQPVATNGLTVTSTNPSGRPDTDGDGMPDEWELVNGLDGSVPDAGKDPDGDGLSNLGEFLAGTIPVEPRSRLDLAVEPNGNEIGLQFEAKGGRAYRVQSCPRLSAPWVNVVAIPAAPQGRIVRHSEAVGAPGGTVFYRVVLDIPVAN